MRTPGTFANVIRGYLASEKFASLAPSSRNGYARILYLAERPELLGALPVDVIRPALVQAFLDGLASTPGKQRNAKTALNAVQKWALVRDLLPYPITTGTEANGAAGGFRPWTPAEIEIAEIHAKPHLSRIITLASNTGQRGSDVVKMRWSDIEEYEGRLGINVTQKKTGLPIWIPMTNELDAAVRTWERRPTFLCLKEDGQPWTRTALTTQWARERDSNPHLAPLAELGLVLHGLRAAAVVRLRRAGASTLQICDMVGMSEPMVTRYCRLSAQKQNAMAAVHFLGGTQQKHIRNDRRNEGG